MDTNKKTFDVVVVGGGIFGLWVAKRAFEAGLSVMLAEKDHIGAGASGGLLGALMPHIPTGWNEKKQFQFEALAELSKIVEQLEAETGFDTGYGRIGRLMPLRSERFVTIAETREQAAREVWHQEAGQFDFKVGCDEDYAAWLPSDGSPHGYVLDKLAARVNPRLYVSALAAWLRERATVSEGLRFDQFHDGTSTFNDGAKTVTAGAFVLAQGYQTFDFLRDAHDLDIGTGIKGQAARFRLADTTGLPVIYDDGVYIVPHDDGTCSVGSTSEKVWDHPSEPDLSNTGFLDKAFALCPRLADAELIDRWAGVRPKCHEREPIIGRLFEDAPVYIATGGFKVSFGIAHRVAEALVEEMTRAGRTVALPETFTVGHHLGAASNEA
ncbi:MAG: FAD-binding oxidoreductase [Pseudomonadota bacterium]